MTGIDVEAVDYRPKWLDILKAVAPNVRTVAVLADANETPGVLKLKDAAPRFGVTLTFLSSLPPDFDESLAAIASGRFDGLIVNDNPTLFSLTPRIAALVAESRTPTVYGEAAEAKMGGLIGYSFDVFDAGLRWSMRADIGATSLRPTSGLVADAVRRAQPLSKSDLRNSAKASRASTGCIDPLPEKRYLLPVTGPGMTSLASPAYRRRNGAAAACICL